MKKLLMAIVLLTGCTSPQEILILPSMGMGGWDAGGGGNIMPRIEYQCPLCTKQFKTEFLAQKCIDSHDE